MPRTARSRLPEPPEWREIVVRMRDVETGSTSELRRAGWVPVEDDRRRTALVEMVKEDRPAARPKSYHEGVASFVDGRELIVVSVRELAEPPASEANRRTAPQAPLFSDAA